jgi:hypothetical protein
MELELAEVLDKYPELIPGEICSHIRVERKRNGVFAFLVGKKETGPDGKSFQDEIFLGRVLEDSEGKDRLYCHPVVGLYRMTMESGFTDFIDFTEKSILEKRRVLQYGNAWVYDSVLKRFRFDLTLKKAFPDHSDVLNSLTLYGLTEPADVDFNGEKWLKNSYADVFYRDSDLSKGSLIHLFSELGEESAQKKFYELYLRKFICTYNYGLPEVTEDHLDIPTSTASYYEETVGGRKDGKLLDKNLIIISSLSEGLPFALRYDLTTNAEKSSLLEFLKSIEKYPVNLNEVVVDVGVVDSDALGYLNRLGTVYTARLDRDEKVIKKLSKDFGINPRYPYDLTLYRGKEILCQREKIMMKVAGVQKDLYIYICQGQDKQYADLRRDEKNDIFMREKRFDPKNRRSDDFPIIVLVSNHNFSSLEIIRRYYMRYLIEINFDNAKNFTRVIVPRYHNETTFKGFLLTNFIKTVVTLLAERYVTDPSIDPWLIFEKMKGLKLDYYRENVKVLRPMGSYEKELFKIMNLRSDDFISIEDYPKLFKRYL